MNGILNAYIYYKNSEGKQSYVLREKGKDVKEIALPKDAELKYTIEKIMFKRDGSPDKTGTTITIKHRENKKEITIVPVSGRVLIKEGIYET